LKRAKRTEHGLSSHRLNKIWRMMRQRCNNPKDNAFKNYGGKGVTICKEWNTFINFYNWAMSNGYQEGLTIDRKDSNGNYEPSNCEWVTRAENCRRAQKGHSRGNKFIEYRGRSLPLMKWSEELGIKYMTLYQRLKKMSVEEAFTKEVK
jgi:hypothetical protein